MTATPPSVPAESPSPTSADRSWLGVHVRRPSGGHACALQDNPSPALQRSRGCSSTNLCACARTLADLRRRSPSCPRNTWRRAQRSIVGLRPKWPSLRPSNSKRSTGARARRIFLLRAGGGRHVLQRASALSPSPTRSSSSLDLASLLQCVAARRTSRMVVSRITTSASPPSTDG